MVLNELMRTERDYVRDLYLCRTALALPMREKGMLNEEECIAIFSNLDMLLAFNTVPSLFSLSLFPSLTSLPLPQILFNELAAQLTQHKGDGVGKCFLKLADFLKMYSAYCTNHTQAVARIKQLQEQRPEIPAFLVHILEANERRRVSLIFFSLRLKRALRSSAVTISKVS
jgi:hypothetical protein